MFVFSVLPLCPISPPAASDWSSAEGSQKGSSAKNEHFFAQDFVFLPSLSTILFQFVINNHVANHMEYSMCLHIHGGRFVKDQTE